jgi:Reverse transcriptase (RNA-dependent DNA polymerase)
MLDIRMDVTRKASLVAGGHVTDLPASIKYSSVASRESVRIDFLIAELNDLNILAADIGNAYLNTPAEEKVYTITRKEFGEDANKIAIIIRALFGLKSSGAAWHNYFDQSLSYIGFTTCYSDMDIWRHSATKNDGSEYYEYFASCICG